MPKTMTASGPHLSEQLERLAAFEPSDAPVLSLYLDLRPDQHGRDQYEAFVRKSFKAHARGWQGAARTSYAADVRRIRAYLADHVRPSANGLAIFACSARNLFEPLQLDAPLIQHLLCIAPVPHLYPLARLGDQYPRYAALVLDTNAARLFVFGLGTRDRQRDVQNAKTKKSALGGWSQARYQRHVEHLHLQHMKEVVDVLDRTVRDERLAHIVLACDEVARPALMAQLPPHLAEKVVDVVRLGIDTPEHEIMQATLEALQAHDDETDRARVESMLSAWHAGGLALVGPEATLDALSRGQVDELLITANPDWLRQPATVPIDSGAIAASTSAPAPEGVDQARLSVADRLIAEADRTGARIRFIEDPALLVEVGGAGACLRFKV